MRFFGILFISGILVLTAACGTGNVPVDGSNSSGKGESEQMKTEPLDFTVEEPETLPTKVKTVVEKLTGSQSKNNVSLNVEGRTYLILALGERPTGGYHVNVSKVEQRDNILHVYAEEKAPAEGAMVIQVISYPYTVVSVEGNYAEDEVKFHVQYAEQKTS